MASSVAAEAGSVAGEVASHEEFNEEAMQVDASEVVGPVGPRDRKGAKGTGSPVVPWSTSMRQRLLLMF